LENWNSVLILEVIADPERNNSMNSVRISEVIAHPVPTIIGGEPKQNMPVPQDPAIDPRDCSFGHWTLLTHNTIPATATAGQLYLDLSSSCFKAWDISVTPSTDLVANRSLQ
jgi:hypothetical protein